MPGPKQVYKVVARNPNPNGSCLCSPNSHVSDCVAPFVHFTSAELMDPRAPYAVACIACVRGAVKKDDPQAFSPKVQVIEVPDPQAAVINSQIAAIRAALELAA